MAYRKKYFSIRCLSGTPNTFYDSQSGRWVEKIRKGYIRLHDFTFPQCIKDLLTLVIFMNPKSVNVSGVPPHNIPTVVNNVAIMAPNLELTKYAINEQEIELLSQFQITPILHCTHRSFKSLVKFSKEKKLKVMATIPCDNFGSDADTYRIVDHIASAGDDGVDRIILLGGQVASEDEDNDKMLQVIEDSFNLDVEGCPMIDRLGLLSHEEACRIALGAGVTNFVCSSRSELIKLEKHEIETFYREPDVLSASTLLRLISEHNLVVDQGNKNIVRAYEEVSRALRS